MQNIDKDDCGVQGGPKGEKKGIEGGDRYNQCVKRIKNK